MIDRHKTSEGAANEFYRANALGRKGFVAFLARFDDADKDIDAEALDAIDDETMKERLEVFEIKEKLVQDIKDVYINELGGATGIEFSDDDLKCVDLSVEDIAVEDPKRLLRMNEEIGDYHAYPEQIKDAEGELRSAELAMEGTGLLGKAKMYFGLIAHAFNPHWGTHAVEVQRAKRYINAEGIPNGIAGIKERFARLKESGKEQMDRFESIKAWKAEELKELQDNFTYLKENLFAGLSFHGEISRLMKKKVKDYIMSIAGDGTLESIDEAVDTKEEMRDQNALGIDFMTEKGEAGLEKKLDAKATQEVERRIQTALEGLTPADTAEDSFGELKSALADIVDLEKVGTTKDEQATRKVVFGLLAKCANGLPKNADGRAKKIMIRELIIQLKS